MFLGVSCLMSSLKSGFGERAAAYNKSGAYAEQALNAIKVVSAFGQEEVEGKSFCAYLDQSKKRNIRNNLKGALGFSLFVFFILASYSYALYIGGIMVYHDVYNEYRGRDYSAGDVIGTFFGILIGIFTLGMALPNIAAITEGRINAKAALDIMDHVPDIKLDEPGKPQISMIETDIILKDISFTYTEKEVPAVKKINCTIEKGQMTAFVGASGSGKSTITKLVERFYDPQEGEIIVNGQNLKDFNLRSYRQRVGYVGQEPVLFNQTIRENILYGNPNATEEEIIDALKKANAYDFVTEKNLLDANVGSSGSQLSGGQKQRIALARAFIKNPDVLILDEATSALDRKNEALVQKAIDDIQKSNTSIITIVIAHRLSTIKNANKIVVMQKGEIVEVGDHKSLLSEYPDGVYSHLVKRQQFVEDDKDIESDSDEKPKSKKAEVTKKHSTHGKDAEYASKIDEKTKIADEEYETWKTRHEELAQASKKRGVFCRLLSLNNPKILIFTGLIASTVHAGLFPAFAIYWTKILFAMMKNNKHELLDGVEENALAMFLIAIIGFCSSLVMKFSFGIISENMTKDLRGQLYMSILRKHIGWFDNNENSPGQLTSVLSGEVQAVNGASTESVASMIEGMLQILVGICLAFIFEWRIALLCIGLAPFLVLSSSIQTSVTAGFEKKKEDQLKEANTLVSDAIINNLTVASFGHEYLLIEKYKQLMTDNLNDSVKKAHIAGVGYGLAQFITFASYGLLFWSGSKFVEKYHISTEDMFIAIFVIMFAAWGSGQAQQYAPAAGKGKKSAFRIYGIIDEETELDPVAITTDQVFADVSTFRGDIEFRDVWFRYPSRRDQWVLKGATFQIKSNTLVGLAGESGCGKSTIVQLIYRFYDPQFGQILIDGVDLKDYNIASLRKQFGLVQQEPILFNYSIKDNIAYAKAEADDQEILNAAEVANATEFINTLHQTLQKEGSDENKKEEDEAMVLFRNETDQLRTDTLPSGYSIACGVKGGKLSGGQKQRIAIARAIIRQPHLLMLDEATSALDEESQNKVQVALDRIMHDRTSIVIAHRLTTIQKCDNIIVLRNGVVQEQGTFKELINKKNGYFAQISSDLV